MITQNGASRQGGDADASVRPLQPADAGTRIIVTANASVATTGNVAAGRYVISIDKASGVLWICWGNTAVLPDSGATASAGTMPVRDGAMITAPGGTKLSAILTDITATADVGISPLS